MDYNGFDINTVDTPAPWGAREEQCIKDIIDTLVGDTVSGGINTDGHKHVSLYYDDSEIYVDCSVESTINLGSLSTPIETVKTVLDETTGVFNIVDPNDRSFLMYDVSDRSLSVDGSLNASGSAFIQDDLYISGTMQYGSVPWARLTDITSPTITASGDCTGSCTLTNLGNATLDLTVLDDSHTHSTQYLPLTGGTLSGELYILSGNVGIGITNPDSTLHIHEGSAGSVDGPNNSILVVENNGDTYISMLSPNTGNQGIVFGDANDNNVGMLRYYHTDNAMSFVANASERMRIDSGGNVGIGKSSLEDWETNYTALQIGGNSSLMSKTAEAAGSTLILVNNAYYDSSSNWRRVTTDEASMVVISDGMIRFRTDGSDTADAAFTPTERMRIDSSGNVGIGTTTATKKLDVNGDINAGVTSTETVTLYDGVTSRDTTTAYIKKCNGIMHIQMAPLSGTITGSSETLITFPAGVLENPLINVVMFNGPILNNSNDEVGLYLIDNTAGSITIRTSSNGYLTAGTGGSQYLDISYRYE